MKPVAILFLLLSMPYLVLGQESIIIKGVVSDDIGTLSEANVIIKNTNIGVTTDFDGSYEINAKTTDTLSISYLGYETKEVFVGNKKRINIFLSGDIKLDEVILHAHGNCKKTYCITCRCGVTMTQITSKNFKSNLITPTLYPNPSIEGRFKLTLLDDYRNIQIQVSNISGQIIKTDNYQNIDERMDIDLSGFPSGIYIINIIADGKHLPTKKAIIGG